LDKKLSKNILSMVSNQFKILSEPLRLGILQELKEGEKCVSDLVESLAANQANISKHLSLLTNANMVGRRKDGLKVYYYITSPVILELCQTVCTQIEADLRDKLEDVS